MRTIRILPSFRPLLQERSTLLRFRNRRLENRPIAGDIDGQGGSRRSCKRSISPDRRGVYGFAPLWMRVPVRFSGIWLIGCFAEAVPRFSLIADSVNRSICNSYGPRPLSGHTPNQKHAQQARADS